MTVETAIVAGHPQRVGARRNRLGEINGVWPKSSSPSALWLDAVHMSQKPRWFAQPMRRAAASPVSRRASDNHSPAVALAALSWDTWTIQGFPF